MYQVDQRFLLMALLVNFWFYSQADDIIVDRLRTKRQLGGNVRTLLTEFQGHFPINQQGSFTAYRNQQGLTPFNSNQQGLRTSGDNQQRFFTGDPGNFHGAEVSYPGNNPGMNQGGSSNFAANRHGFPGTRQSLIDEIRPLCQENLNLFPECAPFWKTGEAIASSVEVNYPWNNPRINQGGTVNFSENRGVHSNGFSATGQGSIQAIRPSCQGSLHFFPECAQYRKTAEHISNRAQVNYPGNNQGGSVNFLRNQHVHSNGFPRTGQGSIEKLSPPCQGNLILFSECAQYRKTTEHVPISSTTRSTYCKGTRNNRPECKNNQIASERAVTAAFNSISDAVSSSNPGLPETLQQNQPFQQCATPNSEPGHCRFLQHCILKEFLTDFNTFLKYVCFIEGRSVGVCCPSQRSTIVASTTQWPPALFNSRECGMNSLIQTRIASGNDTKVNEYPWATSLIRKNNGLHFCGGFLITERYVLTAAHCLKEMDSSMITIRLGEHSFEQGDESLHEDFNVSDINIHKYYNDTNYMNDIAILKMDRPTDFSKYISVICLPTAADLYTDDKATVIGWGAFHHDGPYSKVLQEVSIKVWSNSECKAAYAKSNYKIFDESICAGNKDGQKDSCEGDSGGPLMIQRGRGFERKWYVIGLVSQGLRCGELGIPGIYVRVSKYIDWIGSKAI